MSDGGNSGLMMCGVRRPAWHAPLSAAQKAAQPWYLPFAQPEPYDTHAAGGAP